MRYIFNFPDIGEGLEEGTIVEWYVTKGQKINSGDSLLKMDTDKVVTDIPSPKSGIIAAIYGKIGETVRVGAALVELEIEGVSGADALNEAQKDSSVEIIEEKGAAVVGTIEVAGSNAHLPASDEGILEKNIEDDRQTKKVLATPVVRALAKEMRIDINKITGTGPAGRVMKEDIYAYLQNSLSTIKTSKINIADERVEIKPLTQIRKSIARNMALSKHSAAHMTVHDEVEISELIREREKYKEKYLSKGIKLSYLPFIIKATVLALKTHKILNSQLDIDNNQIIYKNYYNMGIAVDTDEGLIVPVIKDADKFTIFELAQKINELSEKAKKRELNLDEIKDGTFTITNYGSIGGQFGVPIINFPQVAILGIGRIMKKPIVKNDAVVIGNILPLSISVDHRIVDGGETSRFLNQIMEYLTDPVSFIME
ncbi:MAG: dihydrolipoamide acetyltransferase family protein [Bacteroidales bacterium]|jgi:pyruvate dehydrogenase E2 component (dihydrolipoamide acetyltransferase)